MKHLLFVLLLVLLLVLGYRAGMATPPLPVASELRLQAHEVQPLTLGMLTETVHASGHLRPWRQAVLSVPVSGNVEQIMVRPGMPVSQRTLVLRLETLPFDAALAEAVAQLKEAKAEHGLSTFLEQQQQQLIEKEFTSQTDRYSAQARAQHALARLENAQAAVALAQNRYEHAHVRAPFEGFITEQHTQEGEAVVAGTPLLTLSDTHTLELPLHVPVAKSLSLHPGQEVMLHVRGVEHPLQGVLDRINTVTSGNSHAIMAFVQVPNPNQHLKAGLFAQAELVIQQHDDVLLVPRTAIQYDAKEQPYLFTVENEHLVRHDVLIHPESGKNHDQVWVETQAPLGTLIVTTHLPHAKAGQTIAHNPE